MENVNILDMDKNGPWVIVEYTLNKKTGKFSPSCFVKEWEGSWHDFFISPCFKWWEAEIFSSKEECEEAVKIFTKTLLTHDSQMWKAVDVRKIPHEIRWKFFGIRLANWIMDKFHIMMPKGE